ncbi:E3 SUMO-protein ligase pli1 [Morella rubra]|uniref:E3 SUMO-protein ligase pli1 n=1 Tax=Morella rubra TaxID=262757 RepID=A0A6A1VXV7_9ROSI|nr:E3 SUMO-protein ligase pli1 [Morella rubra]
MAGGPFAGFAGTSLRPGGPVTSSVNSFRVSAMAERLETHFQPGNRNDPAEFFKLCLALARGIDYAVANNEIPSKAQDLPSLLKKVCQRKSDLLLQAAIMVLMISVKNACKMGWFSEKDTNELSTLANEIGSSFCSLGDVNTGPSDSLSTVGKIMERFYPRMKMGHILASLEVKPGYGVYIIDFHISKNILPPQEKIWFFVAQTDSIETSACIISPPQVSFLLNGIGVDRRTNVQMDTGPQFPTNVTGMLQYGTNLLQAIGQFNGHYIIAVAFISVDLSPDTPMPPDYIQPAVAAVDSDADIIEGPSRISLHCPISYTRIKTPVKGHSCKHLQCFDFGNFLEINLRRPSWRCPHCNQSVCYLDLRLDQNMVKASSYEFLVLREVGENVDEVIISADGSWQAGLKNDDHVEQVQGKTINCQKEKNERQESMGVLNILPNVFDLTEDNDEMEAVTTREMEDRKPLCADLPAAKNLTSLPELNTTNGVNQNVAAVVEDEFWSGVYLSTGSMNSCARSNDQRVGGISESISTNLMGSPALTTAVSPALNQQANLSTSRLRSQCFPSNFQLQQAQYGNSTVDYEYGRFPLMANHASRTPMAVQALPVQSQASNLQQRPRSSLNSQVAPSVAPIADAFHATRGDMERQQHFRAPSSSLQRPPITQNRDHPLSSPFSRLQSGQREYPGLLTDFQNSHLQQALNPRPPQPVVQSSSTIRQSPHLPRTPNQQGGAQGGISQAAGTISHQQTNWLTHPAAGPMARQASAVPILNQTSRTGSVIADGSREGLREQRGNIGGTSQTAIRADSLLDPSLEQNWQPQGRMRGSLSPQNFAAFDQFMILPTPQVQTQTARPPPNPTPAPSVTHQRQAFIANSRNANSPQTPNIQ